MERIELFKDIKNTLRKCKNSELVFQNNCVKVYNDNASKYIRIYTNNVHDVIPVYAKFLDIETPFSLGMNEYSTGKMPMFVEVFDKVMRDVAV